MRAEDAIDKAEQDAAKANKADLARINKTMLARIKTLGDFASYNISITNNQDQLKVSLASSQTAKSFSLVTQLHQPHLTDQAQADLAKGYGELSIPHFLASLTKAQRKLGIPLARHIILAGCYVFARLSPQDVAQYRNFALNLNVDIIGSRTLYVAGIAKMAKFSAAGQVSDYAYVGSAVPLAPILEVIGENSGYDNSWFTCHAGRTQDAGAACQRKLASNQTAAQSATAAPSP